MSFASIEVSARCARALVVRHFQSPALQHGARGVQWRRDRTPGAQPRARGIALRTGPWLSSHVDALKGALADAQAKLD